MNTIVLNRKEMDEKRVGTAWLDRALSLYRDGCHSVNILVAPEQILKPL